MPRTEFDFIQAEDNDFASQYELDDVKDYNTGNFVVSTMNNYALYLKEGQSSYAKLGQLTFGSNLVDYFKNTSNSWRVCRRFYFPGTNVIGIPVRFRTISWMGNGTGSIRIYDLTNANTIIEFSITNTSMGENSSANFQNLPTDEAIWEIQTTEGPGYGLTIYISCGYLEF